MTGMVAEGDPVPLGPWAEWPAPEALARTGRTPARGLLAWGIRLMWFSGLLWASIAQRGPSVPGALWLSLGAVVAGLLGVALFRATLRRRLWPSVLILGALAGEAALAWSLHANFPATVLWCVCAVLAIERLPLGAAVPLGVAALAGYALLAGNDSWLVTGLVAAGVSLAGCVARLDAEARAGTQRTLVQERAARAAEAESAALRERGRIAREIHDVLAHSLSAQLLHLEAARLLIERGGPDGEVLERVVAARRMARQGLAETRQALSALRGEMTPVEEFLRELVDSEGARLRVGGDRRDVPAESGLAVRRVAQEAMTNVRKHAPGAEVVVRFDYLPGEVELEVRDFGPAAADNRPVDNRLGVFGSGYGLLGMRERAELLGGTLEAGPAEEGFVVRLRVPT